MPPAVGSVALAMATRAPQADASQVYACSADEFNRQRCTMLSTDNDISWSWVILGVCMVSIITLVLKYFVDMYLRHRFERRAMPVASYVDGDDASPTARPVGFRQSDSSDDPGCCATVRDASTQVNDWQTYSKQELDNEI